MHHKEANAQAQVSYQMAQDEYYTAYNNWQAIAASDGESSSAAQQASQVVQQKLSNMQIAARRVDDTDMPIIPCICCWFLTLKKRISSSDNYFTCNESLFTLTEDEQYNILQMIEDSGQKIIHDGESAFLNLRCLVSASMLTFKLWEGYNKDSVYAACLKAVSDYLLQQTRKDMIPLSDLTAIFEGIDGIDSVRVWFDADVNNQEIYQNTGFYGIDDFGDVVLTRTYTGSNGNTRDVRDVLPLFRGGFTSPDGVEYSDSQSNEWLSAFNMNVTSYTRRTRLATDTPLNWKVN